MIKTIVTRSANEELYNISKSLWRSDNQFHRLTQFGGFQGALDYLLFILNNFDGWVVNADEDFFLINEDLVDSVISEMKKKGFAYCGVPDGGVIAHRNKSVYNVNPFFNVFNVSAIKAKIKSFDASKSREYAEYCEKNYNIDEPFAGLMYWLNRNFTCGNFTQIESTDGISSVIIINDKEVGIHSWYSREYGVNPAQTKRIDNCIEYAIMKAK